MLEKMEEIKKMEGIKMQVMKTPLRMHLQRYTDGGGDGGAGGGDGQGGGGEGSTDTGGDGGQSGTGDTNKPITFDTQADLDAAIAAAVTQAQTAWATETQQKIDDAKTEAQRMANMTDEQKAAYTKQKQEDDLAKREADITQRELRAQALEQLSDKELPSELIEAVVLTGADACVKSIDAIEKSFRKAVEVAVNKRLGDSVQVPGSGAGGSGKDEKGSLGERLAKGAVAKETKKSSYFQN